MEKFTTDIRYVQVDHDPFVGQEIERTIPTTEAQREVFVASEMGRDASCAYNESVSLQLTGVLDRAALEQALRIHPQRHEALRSTISASGTRMIVAGQADQELQFSDVSLGNDAERKNALDTIARTDMSAPFDLLNGPLFRARLIRTGTEEHLLRLTGHHVVCDGWSLGILMAELSTLYNALRKGSTPSLPDAIAFSEYALATIDFAKKPEHEQVESYWTGLFKGPIPRVDLPTDRPRPKQKTYKGERIDLELDAALVRSLKETATRSGASFVTTLLTTFEILLYKLTGDSDLVVGLPAAGQSDLGMKHLVGHCVNLLALRSRIDEERPFVEHLKERRTAVLDAFDNQKYTFGTLLRKLNVPREPGRIPLVPVVFNIDMNMDDGVAFDGLTHRFISNPRSFENFELFLNATGNEERLVVEWSYNTDLFDAATIRNWMNELLRLIARIATAPSASIAELLGEAALSDEQQMPPSAWLGSNPAYPRETGIGTLFDEIAATHAARVALVLADQRMTYSELDQRVRALSTHLVELGVKPGDLVGLCMDRSFEMITSMLAILRAGACFVPFDPAYPAERLVFMFEDTKVTTLLTQRHLLSAMPAHNARVVLPAALDLSTVRKSGVLGHGESAAYVMYTSGSTGRPKGVVVPHRAIIRLVREQNFLPFGPDLTFLQLSNISFDASTLEIWGALLNGATLVLQPQQKPTLVEITDTIRQHGVTTVWFTVGLFNLLVDEHLERLRGLKHILTGGDVLSVPHVKRALRTLGHGVLINGYGPTENTTFTCCHAINDEAALKGSIPIGKPIHNTAVHVLDEHRRPVPIGRKGELYAGGDGVALGYWNRADLTAERFIDDPSSTRPGAKLYRTGDLVRWLADGTIEFIGRTDDQVKVRGFRIELGEIENALNDHVLLKDRVVVVRNDGPGEKQLVCYLVPKLERLAEDTAAREDLITAVRDQLRANLPDHMVPSAFVVMPSFPLNPNGKVDRKALPAPELRPRTMHAKHVAPRDPMERAIAEIWEQFLGTERISANDNFFDLGGHSLIGIQLLARVEERFQQALPLRSLFEAPTIAEFAKLLREGDAHADWKNLSLIQPKGEGTPLFCVHGDDANHFIPRYLGKDRPFYAFFHQGADGRRLEHTSVENIATHFINELRQARPHGPYLLCGYSFGGIVAYEMAQQLTASGEAVHMVALLDTYAPGLHARAMATDRRLYDRIKKAAFRAVAGFFLKRGKPLPAKLRIFHIVDTYDQAVQRYVPAPYKGMLTVVKAERSWGPTAMGWTDLAKGGLDVVVSPGDHYTMIAEPEVGRMVEVLAARIADAEARSSVEAV